MALGAFSPLPLRLGGTDKTGLTAADQSRMASDLAAVKRALPYAVLTGTLASSVFTLASYTGRNGGGSPNAPTVTGTTASTVTFTWSALYEDPYERAVPVNITHAEVTMHGSVAYEAVATVSANVVTVDITVASTGAAGEGKFTVAVYTDEGAHFADYGGDPDKENSLEGDVPYAALWFNELKAMRGSAYTQEEGTLVYAENLAISRIFSAVYSRTPEKLVSNSSPGRADEKLAEWVMLYRVRPRPGDRDYQTRKKLAARSRAPLGPTFDNENSALSDLLGDIFVSATRPKGDDIATPPPVTYWAGINPGPVTYDMGGGTWSSERAHLFVEVQQPADGDLNDFNDLTRRQLFELLDGFVPSWVTFDFATSSGFLLDISDMDFDGMGD